ncbi:MAG: hypothetical protein MZU79_02445 [Anaerotruncus sp.]|nr:hypothetical protein [Anaerotruncus sp.]
MERFVRVLGVFPVGTLVRLNSGMLAVIVERGNPDVLKPKVKVIYNARKGEPVSVYPLDLSDPGVEERIEGHETPSNWGLSPMDFL